MRTILGLTAAAMVAACGSDETGAKASEAAPEAGPASAAASVGSAMASQTRKFRDWLAVCDNGNACFAFGPSEDGSGWVQVAMKPGGAERPVVTVAVGPPSDGDTIVMPVSIVVDGQRFATEPVATPAATGLVRGDAAAVITGMARGSSMSLTAGGETTAISLNGAAAALLWIDERQGRLGTTTALIRRGDRPASAVPAPPALPVVQAVEPVSQAGFEGTAPRPLPASLEVLPAVVACRAETDFNKDFQRAVIAGRVSAATELWGVPCSGGAYNMGYRFFLSGPDGRSPRPITLPASGEAAEVVINPSFEPSMQLIYGFSKGRGLGDCGTLSTWAWTGEAFALKTESAMDECWGVPQSLWPTTWRTRDEP